jgi:hypothetical protein
MLSFAVTILGVGARNVEIRLLQPIQSFDSRRGVSVTHPTSQVKRDFRYQNILDR